MDERWRDHLSEQSIDKIDNNEEITRLLGVISDLSSRGRSSFFRLPDHGLYQYVLAILNKSHGGAMRNPTGTHLFRYDFSHPTRDVIQESDSTDFTILYSGPTFAVVFFAPAPFLAAISTPARTDIK